MSERGLIVGEAMDMGLTSGRISTRSTLSSSQSLRHWCLFWDKIEYVRQPAIATKWLEDADRDFLLSERILSIKQDQPTISGSAVSIIKRAYLGALTEREEAQPGAWALALGPDTFNPTEGDFFEGEGAPDRGLLVNLYGVIPVPNRDVPLEDVLAFKVRRNSELMALRHHVDGICLTAAENSTDPNLAIRTSLDGLASAVNDCLQVYREQRLPFRFTQELISINALAGACSIGGSLATGAPLPMLLANAVGAAVSVTAGVEWARRKKSASPFAYVAAYHEEVFVE